MKYEEKKTALARAQTMIREADARFSACLDGVAERISGMEGGRVIRLSGPTCSGKTTAANLLTGRFSKRGKHLHLISIDDFYYDKEVLHAASEETENGKVDYDSVKTIDLGALSDFAREIFTEKKSHCPIFDFKEGRRIGYRTVESGPDDVFLFEGIQAVYPEVTEILSAFGAEPVGIYICPERAVESGGARFEPNELRLLRRLVRDYNFRGTAPDFTLALWEGVRSNEEKHIFPYAAGCAYRIDSAMPYELGILKPYLDKILPTVPQTSPHWTTAARIREALSGVEPLPDRFILPGSLYKEFV